MNNLRDFYVELTKLQRKCEQVVAVAPRKLGIAVRDDIRQNFKRQGLLTDSGLVRWMPSKAALRERRNTLIKSGALMGAITYEADNRRVLVGVDMNAIRYAKRHNEGLKKMPKRQFMYIRKQVIQDVIKELDAMIK